MSNAAAASLTRDRTIHPGRLFVVVVVVVVAAAAVVVEGRS